MKAEQIVRVELKGFKYNPELDKYNDVPMFEENLAQVNEMLRIYGVPIIENGKIIGTRFPPDESGKEVVKMKVQEYKLDAEEISLVQEQSFAYKLARANEIIETRGIPITDKNGKTKIVSTPKQKKAKAKKKKTD